MMGSQQQQQQQQNLIIHHHHHQQQRGMSTKERLLVLVDDVETIVKELLETTLAPKNEKLSPSDQSSLIQLLMEKNDEFKASLTVASEQHEIDEKMMQLASEVARHDHDIQMLQKHLKEADTILSTALFQAKQKLEQIQKAQLHQVSSEDLIRFAHRISSTNAVAAPATWAPGDPRRPYPTDIEMRMGVLARINDTPISQVLDSLHPPASSTGMTTPSRGGGGSDPSHPNFYTQQGSGQPWYSTELPGVLSSSGGGAASSIFASATHHHHHNMPPEPVRGGGGAAGGPTSNNNHDDVEVMSTDSSSSSSSDSQ